MTMPLGYHWLDLNSVDDFIIMDKRFIAMPSEFAVKLGTFNETGPYILMY